GDRLLARQAGQLAGPPAPDALHDELAPLGHGLGIVEEDRPVTAPAADLAQGDNDPFLARCRAEQPDGRRGLRGPHPGPGHVATMVAFDVGLLTHETLPIVVLELAVLEPLFPPARVGRRLIGPAYALAAPSPRHNSHG